MKNAPNKLIVKYTQTQSVQPRKREHLLLSRISHDLTEQTHYIKQHNQIIKGTYSLNSATQPNY